MRGQHRRNGIVLELAVTARSAVQLVAAVSAAFVATSLVLRLAYVNGYLTSFGFTINEILNVDAERNPPTWAQASIMLACGALSWIISQRTGHRGWQLISLFFVFISMDEAGRLHENLIGPLQRLFGTEGTVLHYAWVIPAIPALAVLAHQARGALGIIPASERARLVTAATVFLLGSVGLEMLGGPEVVEGVDTTPYVLMTHLEEAFEFAGLVGALAALLDLAGRDQAVRVADRRHRDALL